MFFEIHQLLCLYDAREDLQLAFPEVKEGNLKNLINWGLFASSGLYNDKNALDNIGLHREFFYHANRYENFLPQLNWKTLPSIFFVLGAGRSGSNLVKRILNYHSMIVTANEGRSYDCIDYPTCLKYERIFESTKKWLGLISIGLTPSLLTDDFVPFPLVTHDNTILGKKFRRLYDNQPIIFLIRDVRDRVASMYNHIRKSTDDLDGVINLYLTWFKQNQYISENFSQEINKIHDSKNILMNILSLEWKIDNSAFFKYKERRFPILDIKYEDLVTDTKDTLQKITSFLDISFEESMLDFYKMPHPDLKDLTIEFNYDIITKNIDASSIGSYTKYLNVQQINEIMYISEDMMKSLHYL